MTSRRRICTILCLNRHSLTLFWSTSLTLVFWTLLSAIMWLQPSVCARAEQKVKSSHFYQIELSADVIWNISSYWTWADWTVTGWLLFSLVASSILWNFIRFESVILRIESKKRKSWKKLTQYDLGNVPLDHSKLQSFIYIYTGSKYRPTLCFQLIKHHKITFQSILRRL